MKNLCKISVIIISYNQEEVIRRAIDSVMMQKKFLYELIISDDCSNDRTWDIITEYEKKYKGLVKPFRHKVNQGIFGNLESTWSKVTGDLIFFLSGDDALNEGLLKRADHVIKANNVTLTEDYLLYFDYQSINPKGDVKLYSNRELKKHNSLYLKLRNRIANRTMGMSSSILAKHYRVEREEGISVNEEGVLDLQPHLFAKYVYYEEFIGSTYYTEIGVSNHLDRSNYNLSKIKYCDTVIDILVEMGKEENLFWMYLYKMKLVLKYNRTLMFKTFYELIIFLLSKKKVKIKG